MFIECANGDLLNLKKVERVCVNSSYERHVTLEAYRGEDKFLIFGVEVDIYTLRHSVNWSEAVKVCNRLNQLILTAIEEDKTAFSVEYMTDKLKEDHSLSFKDCVVFDVAYATKFFNYYRNQGRQSIKIR